MIGELIAILGFGALFLCWLIPICAIGADDEAGQIEAEFDLENAVSIAEWRSGLP